MAFKPGINVLKRKFLCAAPKFYLPAHAGEATLRAARFQIGLQDPVLSGGGVQDPGPLPVISLVTKVQPHLSHT